MVTQLIDRHRLHFGRTADRKGREAVRAYAIDHTEVNLVFGNRVQLHLDACRRRTTACQQARVQREPISLPTLESCARWQLPSRGRKRIAARSAGDGRGRPAADRGGEEYAQILLQRTKLERGRQSAAVEGLIALQTSQYYGHGYKHVDATAAWVLSWSAHSRFQPQLGQVTNIVLQSR